MTDHAEPLSAPDEDRFWARVKFDPSGCWEWTGYLDQGYGQTRYEGRPIRTHRLVWLFVNGPIPAGMHVLHHCDNRRCVRPIHLYLGTNLDNIRDKVERRRCADLRGARNGRAKLTPEAVTDIRSRAAAGERTASIARAHGIGWAAVARVIKGRTWTNV